jgi:hypothetical protein
MAILDRPMFQRRPTKDELRRYGLPAFANGGVVKMRNGGSLGMGPGQSLAMFGDINYASVPRPKTAEELLEEDYGKLGKFVAGERAITAREEEEKQQERLMIEQVKSDKERVEKDKADREAMALLRKDKKDNTTVVTDTDDPFEEDKSVSDERTEMGRLQEIIKERSALYKKLLGDPKEQLKQQGFLQLAQFGLNLAAARGGNLAEKIAKSATDPLQTFAALARDASKDERAIELAAIESGEAQILKEIENQGDLSNIGKSVRDIARIKGIDLNKAYVEYEALLKDEDLKSDFDMFVEAQGSLQFENDLEAAKTSARIPLSKLESFSPYITEEGIDKKAVNELYMRGKVFRGTNEQGDIVAIIPKESALKDKNKKFLDENDFTELDTIKVFKF